MDTWKQRETRRTSAKGAVPHNPHAAFVLPIRFLAICDGVQQDIFTAPAFHAHGMDRVGGGARVPPKTGVVHYGAPRRPQTLDQVGNVGAPVTC